MSKIVLITGAARGLGKEIALKYIQENDTVIITYLKNGKLAKKMQQDFWQNYHQKIMICKCDITKSLQIKRLKNLIMKKFGKLDILINNANYEMDNDIYHKTSQEFLKVIKTNILGNFLMVKYLSPLLKNGQIINISSLDAESTYQEINLDYSASKAAVNNLTKNYAQIFPNIKTCALMLPWLKTESTLEMNPIYLKEQLLKNKQKALIEPQEVARLIYNLTNKATYESGKIFKMEDINE